LHGKNINYDSFTALNFQSPYHTDQERLDGAVRSCRNAVPADLYLIYLAAPDAFGHLYGPDSKELRKRMRIMDVQLARFVNEMDSLPVDCDFLFLGDHGMHAVQESVDGERVINSLLRRCGLKKGRDVVYFLDSTMIRIWFLDSGHSSSLIDLLRSNVDLQRCGEWLDVERARELGIPWPDRRYGDLLWLAREGVQVFPDFFHRHVQPKGMHGYDPRLAHAKGTCIYWGSRVKMESAEEINLSDVHQLLREILGI
jgi:predicted AlkP superfamily pyrophosphatase or phosphodiesterase